MFAKKALVMTGSYPAVYGWDKGHMPGGHIEVIHILQLGIAMRLWKVV